MPYVKIPDYMDVDLIEQAEVLKIDKEQVLERKYFGYEVQEEIAGEAKEALMKYKNSEEERYKIVEMWWKKTTDIVKNCYDILKESMEK